MLDPAVPHLVVNSRTLYFSWLPADPDAVAALVPPGLRPHPDREVFMNQYVVDDESQTSGFGSYSLTYLGVTLVGMDAPDGVTPGGWWTHYVTSSERCAPTPWPGVPGRARSHHHHRAGRHDRHRDGHRGCAGDPSPGARRRHRTRHAQRPPPLPDRVARSAGQQHLSGDRRTVHLVRDRIGRVSRSGPPGVRVAPGEPAHHRLGLLLAALLVRVPGWADDPR